MSICYYFHPDGYTTAGRQVMGRHVAGESFLKGALLHGSKSDLWIQIEDKKHIKVFETIARSCGRHEPIHSINRSNLSRVSEPGCLYLPGPGIGEWARHRSRFGDASWSLCGITHTTASTTAMDAIAELLTAPVQPWDALICTSRAVQNNVRRILEAEAEYLRRRLDASKIITPKLPVIPLGVHTDNFNYSQEFIEQARQHFNIEQDDIVVLFVGRLAFHGKAHPLVMYQALERAATATGRSVVLIECGWHANKYIQHAFANAAATACPSVRCISTDGRDPELLKLSWACADLFCSLSDNIQETFGITPIEAMAAGLPVVVTDWDGYKDTVRDGIDGFRIPTSMPPPGFGDELASRHALGIDNYDMYCAHASSLVAVDLASTTQALIKLISSRELRQKMGANGRQRALEIYDWKAIIPIYENLFSELKSRRDDEHDCSPHPHPSPSRLDPFYGFASYPTSKIGLQSMLSITDVNSTISVRRFRQLIKLEMVNYVADRMASQQELESVLLKLGSASATAGSLIPKICKSRHEQRKLFLSIIWLNKLGLIKIEK